MRKAASGALTILITATAVFWMAGPPVLAGTADDLAGKLSAMFVSSEARVDPAQPSRPGHEMLRGNGSGLGYVLGHGSVIPRSESITVGGSKKIRNKDYHIDYAGGSVVFTQRVPEGHAISVSYRYAETDKGERTIVALPGLSVANTKNLSLNLTYAYRTANRDSVQGGVDLSTYGINSTTKLGAKSSLKSMLYISTPQDRSTSLNLLTGVPKDAPPSQQTKVKRDELILQEGEFGLGRAKIKLGYQDVGKDFAGFAALQDAGAAPAEALAQLAKEKGLKRLDAQAEISLGKGMSLTAASNQVKDAADDITNRSLGFASGSIKASFTSQEVGKKFGRFKDIREANRGQLAREAGIKRTIFGLEFGSDAKKDSPWNKLGMDTIGDASGKIDSMSAALSFGGLGLSYSRRSVDKGFNRIGSLTGEDINKMALEIRQYYDPNANPGQVTDADRKQILTEAGLDRTNLRMSLTGGQTRSSLQMLRIGDVSGAIERRSASIAGKNYSLSLMDQNIDKTFTRLPAMALVEKGEFGNERGMHRTNLAGSLKTGAGDISLGFSKVSDDNGATVAKRSIGFAGKKFSVRANFQDIDSEFDRVADLADANRKEMQQEIGFRRTDISANVQLSNRLGLESFYYDSKNSKANVARQQLRNQLTYTTGFGARITMFRDQFTSNSADGKSGGYLHQWIKLDHKFALLGGLLFNGLHDTKSMADPTGKETTATVDQMRLESDKSKRVWGVADRKIVDFGNGKFENTHSFNLSSKLSKKLNLTGGLTTIDRGDDGSEETRSYGMQWAISGRLNFSADVMDKTGNKSGVTAKRNYALSGILADKFAMFRDLKLTAGRYVEEKEGRLFKETNGVKLETNLLRGSFVAEYASAKDANGNDPFSRGFAFISNRDDKKRLSFGFAYKTRDLGPGDAFAVRRYNVDYKLSPRTNVTYSYFSYNEKPDGKVDPVGGTVLNLSTMIRQFSVTANFKEDENFITRLDRKVYGLSLAGKLAYGALVEVGYSLDDLTAPGANTKARTYRVKYDHQVDTDHFLTLTGEYRTVDNPGPGMNKDLQARIDFRTLFD
ncbi:MAG: hypothetical protein HYX78_04005 [Armatimonadetes bacterium]|nr:hypothetical protein [Armatimonadota bacterium]